MPSRNRSIELLKIYRDLCKIRISLFALLSALTGYILTGSELTAVLIVPMAGVLLLACGACSLNQYQERDTDALMDRTRNRPIPGNKISPPHALSFSVLLLGSGLLFLWYTGKPLLFLLGLFAVVWYNGFYTWLKRKNAFAAVPGALVGALPPAMGWTAAGGSLLDQKILLLCFLFFMWQVPHFWLLLLTHGEEYEKAGFPTLRNIFSQRQLAKITFVWNSAAATACLLMPIYGIVSSEGARLFLAAATLWLLGNAIRIISHQAGKYAYPLAFSRINVYLLILMLLITLEKILYPFI